MNRHRRVLFLPINLIKPVKATRENKGFTLVELLIVVAIIGILSTVGIPVWKKMVQKTKKSEAKVGLGGIYTTEAAFFSEYGAYGSQLDKMGFEMDGNPKYYTFGFPAADCTSIVAVPEIAGTFGLAIDEVFPDYYASGDNSVVLKTGAVACEAGVIPVDGTAFTATAAGVIKPGFTAAAALVDQDIWTIDENRLLRNSQDGVD